VKASWIRAAYAAVIALAAVAATVALGSTAQAQTADAGRIAITGDRDDHVTGGRSYSYDVAAGDWLGVFPTPDFSELGLHVTGADGAEWDLVFAAPDGRTLRPGTYRAVEYASHGARAGLSVVADGRRCDTLTGRFTVLAASFRNGYVERFDATFEQHCEGRRAAARGEIHMANQPLPTMTATTSSGTFDKAGAAHPAGAVICSAPMRVAVLGTVTQTVGGRPVNGEFSVEVDCTPDAAATWTATVPPEGTAPFVRGKAKVDLQAFAYLSTPDVTIDDYSSAIVRLTRA
jgi:hypothetical protein